MIVATEHADVGTTSAGAIPFGVDIPLGHVALQFVHEDGELVLPRNVPGHVIGGHAEVL